MDQLNAFAKMPQNMVHHVINPVHQVKKLKSINLDKVVNVLEPKLELDLKMTHVTIVRLAFIPKEHVTKNVLKKLFPTEQKIHVQLAMLLSKPVTQELVLL